MGELLKTLFLFIVFVLLLFFGIQYFIRVQNSSLNSFALFPGDQINLQIRAFPRDGEIPPKYTCQGPNINPSIDISGVPMNAKSLVVVLLENDRRNGDVYHWIVVNVDPTIDGIKENSIPLSGEHLVNDFRSATYMGPCPDESSHEYVFRVYALAEKLEKGQFRSATELFEYLDKYNIGKGSYQAEYSKL